MARIPYSRQSIGEDDIRAVAKALRSPFITQGPTIPAFESALARYSGARYAVVFSSGTAALHAAYAAAGIGKGDEVVMPALTFVATGNAALYLGAKPVFADCDEETGNVDPRNVVKKLTRRTKAIVAVDFAGLPADLTALRAIARKHRLVFIEDGAQSLGAVYKGKPLGTQADMTMFSFHPVKSITTGEGGVIVTNNKRYFEYLTMFRTHGMTKIRKKLRDKSRAGWHQEAQLLGNNYRLTDIQAALGLSQLKKLDRFIVQRRAAAKRYFPLLKNMPGVVLPPRSGLNTSACHLFVVRVDKRIRDRVFEGLRAKGIGVQVHYLPVYLHPYYRDLGYRTGLCPTAERISLSELSIPLYPALSLKDQKYVVNTLRDILKNL